MIKVKVSELTGAALDWVVANCEGEIAHVQFSPLASSKHYFAPSKKWAQGGPIIEREKIDTKWDRVAWISASRRIQNQERVYEYGPTPLIAAMRCYVASKLGDEVDLPDQLLE